MHLKIENYIINEITKKRTLFQNSKRSMSSFFRQRFVSVMQMINIQSSNTFDVLKNSLNARTFQHTIQNTQSQHHSQTNSKSQKRFLNSKKTIESRQNDDEL